MKISITEATKLLKELGVADAQVVADDKEAETIDVETVATEALDSLKETLKPSIEEELKPSIESALTGRSLGALRSLAGRVFNIPRRELEGLAQDKILEKCQEHASKQSNSDEWQQKYNELLQATEKERDDLIREWETKYNTDVSAANKKYIDRDIDAYCLSVVEKLPRKGGDLQEQAQLLRMRLEKNYQLNWDEKTKKVVLQVDGKPAMNGTKAISIDDEAKVWAEKTGILATGTQHVIPKEVKDDKSISDGIVQDKGIIPESVKLMEAWANEE